MGVKVKDNGYNRVMRSIPTVDGIVEAGVIGEMAGAQHPRAKMTVGELATIHEFGLGNVPERSIVRGFVDDQFQQVMPRIAQLTRMLATGLMEQDEYRAEVEKLLVDGMKKRLDDGIDPPLLASTVNRKEGPAIPLEDTMSIREAISARWVTK